MQSQLLGVPEGALKGALRRASAGLSAKPSRSWEPCGALRLWLPKTVGVASLLPTPSVLANATSKQTHT